MNKVILTILGSALLGYSVAQSKITEIKQDALEIKGRMSLSRYEQDTKQQQELITVMNLDVFKYFDLEKEYDSELKKKLFKETAEYKEKLNEVVKKRQEFLLKDFYLDFEPTYYERNNSLKYDLKTQTFSVTNEIYFYEKNKNLFLQFDHLVLSPQQGITVKYTDFVSGGVRFSEGKIKFRILGDTNALEIEENRSNIKMMFIFRLTNTTEFTNNLLEGWTFKDHLINCKLKSTIVYNSSTNEIYWQYFPNK